MNAPVIDAFAVTTPAVATPPTTSVRDEARAADRLTFQIGMGVVAVVLLAMTVVGAVIVSEPLLIGTGLFAVVAALVHAATDVTLAAH